MEMKESISRRFCKPDFGGRHGEKRKEFLRVYFSVNCVFSVRNKVRKEFLRVLRAK